MATSIGCSLSLSKEAKSTGFFHPLKKNSSLTRLSIGFHPSKNLNSSSSLIACPCRPVETIRGNRCSLPMTYATSVPSTRTSASTESRRPTKQLPLLILAPEEHRQQIIQSVGERCERAIPSVERVIRNSQTGLVEHIISDFSSKIPGLGRDTPDIPLIWGVVLSSSPMDDDCIAVAIYEWKELFYTLSGGYKKELEAWDLHSDPIKSFNTWMTCNRAFFVGKNRSFVLSTTEFPELRSGSIYYADQDYLWEYNFGGHDMGIYDYKEVDFIKLETISPASSWFIPDVNARDVDANF
ncbi:hypothetical protein FXO38_00921 [Capsicum annuum]|nr:hypothetical protein FXO38_00921 [Capsicum annuum]